MNAETNSYTIRNKVLIKVNPDYNGLFVIPDGVEEIGEYAFSECFKITGVVIPKSVLRIKGNSFQNCTGLIGITIPENVVKVSSNVFLGCVNLSFIRILNRNTLIVFNSIPESTTIIIGNEVNYENLYKIMIEKDNNNSSYFQEDENSKQKILKK